MDECIFLEGWKVEIFNFFSIDKELIDPYDPLFHPSLLGKECIYLACKNLPSTNTLCNCRLIV